MIRRAAVVILLALGTAEARAEPVEIAAQPIRHFSHTEPEREKFGPLTFRGGLVLTAANPHFGGFSGLRVRPDGSLVALSDRAWWLTARLAYDGNAPRALEDAEMHPVLGKSGRKFAGTRLGDTEGLEIDDATAWVGIERAHQVVRFDLADGVATARAAPVPGAKGFRDLPFNEGIEALGLVPGGAEEGTLLVVAEAGLDAAGNHRAWLLAGKTNRPPRALSVKRRDGYAVTDLAFLPGGDLVILERRYRPPFALNMRLRRIARADIAEGAVLDGEILIEASLTEEIDNMEGLSAHRAQDGTTVLTLISDDNFGSLQRNVLLQFGLGD